MAGGGVCPSMYSSAPISSSTHVVVVAVIGVGVIVVADVVLGSWIVLYERNKFSIENSYIVASRTIAWLYRMVSHSIETI